MVTSVRLWDDLLEEAAEIGRCVMSKYVFEPAAKAPGDLVNACRLRGLSAFSTAYDKATVYEVTRDLVRDWKATARWSWCFIPSDTGDRVVFAFESDQDAVDFRLRWPWA